MKDGESILQNMTLGQLCRIVEIEMPEGFAEDLKLRDVLGSSIAAQENSAVFVWKTADEESKYQVNDALNKKAAIVFCGQKTKDSYYPDDKRVVGMKRPAVCITKYIKFARHCFDAKVIAVTGSLGKTTTTSMIKCVLSQSLKIHCGGTIENSKGAIIRLTQQIKNDHDVYLQEVGAAEPGHVESLAQGLCPDVAVITNVTDPHLDKYKTRENILKDKASLVELMNEGGVAFFDMDNDMLRSYKTDKKVIYYAIDHKDADYYAENIVQDEKIQSFDIVCNNTGERFHATLDALGVHNTRNALAAFAVGRHMGISAEQIVSALASYKPEGQRQNFTTIGGYRVLLDMFNSAPESVIGAIKVLEDIKVEEGGRRILVIGDMARLGDASEMLHRQVGAGIAECEFDCLYCFGTDIKYAYEEVVKARGEKNVYYTDDREKLNSWIKTNVTRKDVTLYKASQTVALAKTVDAVYGTTYYHGLQGVFISYEESRGNDGIELQYRHVGDYLECHKPMSTEIKAVSIKSELGGVPVRRITQNAFTKCRMLEKVTIPDSVVNIGRRAFYICPSLKTVILPRNLLMIESSAFNYCRSLEKIEIPEGTVSIGSRAFYDCIKLKSVSIPSSVGYMGSEIFDNCPEVVATVVRDSYAMRYCKENGVRYTCIDMDPAKTRYKRGNVQFVKTKNDYRFKVRRNVPEDSSRYVCENAQWRKKNITTPNEAVIMCAGDLMCEPVLSEAAYCDGKYYFQPMLKRVRDIFKNSDFAIANLETIVSENMPYAHEMHVVEHHTGPRYHCNAPLSYLDALRFAGFDGFVLANNHNADGGYEGIVDTIDNLDKWKFMHTGMFRDPKDPRVLIADINGIKVGIMAYTEHVNRKLDRETLTDEGCDVMLNHYNKEKVKRDIELARKNGAEFLLCYIHFLGRDYSHTIINKNVERAAELANLGFDCVMGSHMHAVQGYDVIKTDDGRKVPVIYSLGNFISSDSNPTAKESVVYRLVLNKDEKGVHIKDESYIPFCTVEGFQRAWYGVFPLQKRYRKESEALDKLEADVAQWMGEKLKTYQ